MPNSRPDDLNRAFTSPNPTRHRPAPDTLQRAVEKVRDLVSTVPEELVDRDTLQALLMAADDGLYALQDAERYHGMLMEAQDEIRRLRAIHLLGKQDAEPPNHTVVIDNEGDAWQRDDGNGTKGRWELTGSDYETTGKTWTALTTTYGPVRLVYTPEA